MSLGLATRGYYCGIQGGGTTTLLQGPIKAVVGFKPIEAKVGFKPIRAILADGGCGPMGTDIKLRKGTIATIPFDLEDGDGNPLDATTASSIIFSGKRRIEDTDDPLWTALTLGAGITTPGTPTSSRINVAVDTLQTELDERAYYYDLWVTISGETQSANNGKWIIEGRVRT